MRKYEANWVILEGKQLYVFWKLFLVEVFDVVVVKVEPQQLFEGAKVFYCGDAVVIERQVLEIGKMVKPFKLSNAVLR